MQSHDVALFQHLFKRRETGVNFRRALSLAIDRNVMVQAAWNGYATASNSHVSPALKFWHDNDITKIRTGMPVARHLKRDDRPPVHCPGGYAGCFSCWSDRGRLD